MPNQDLPRRERLLAAAYAVLAERGYEAATVKEVARAAGVAPGLVHYYWRNKEELLTEVLQQASERYTREMQELARRVEPAKLAEAALTVPRTRATTQPEWYRLRYELFALGLRHPALAEGVRKLLAGGRAGIARVTERATGAAPEEAEAAAAVLLACFDGLALQKLVDPAFDLDAAYGALARMARGSAAAGVA